MKPLKISEKEKIQYKKFAKYLRGAGKAIILLAGEIEAAGYLDEESEKLAKKIGAGLLTNSCSYKYLV